MDDTNLIKEFITNNKKAGHLIKIRCDNEHIYYDNADTQYNAPIVWDWDKECFYVLRHNDEHLNNEMTSPFSITLVDFHQIQDMQAYLPVPDIISFINEKYTDATEKDVAMKLLQRAGYAGTWQSRTKANDPAFDIGNKGNIRLAQDVQKPKNPSDEDGEDKS